MVYTCRDCGAKITLSKYEEELYKIHGNYARTNLQEKVENTLDYIFEDYSKFPEKYYYG